VDKLLTWNLQGSQPYEREFRSQTRTDAVSHPSEVNSRVLTGIIAAFSTRISNRPPSLSNWSANDLTEAKSARSIIHNSAVW
jgi:hypothetical protein